MWNSNCATTEKLPNLVTICFVVIRSAAATIPGESEKGYEENDAGAGQLSNVQLHLRNSLSLVFTSGAVQASRKFSEERSRLACQSPSPQCTSELRGRRRARSPETDALWSACMDAWISLRMRFQAFPRSSSTSTRAQLGGRAISHPGAISTHSSHISHHPYHGQLPATKWEGG